MAVRVLDFQWGQTSTNTDTFFSEAAHPITDRVSRSSCAWRLGFPSPIIPEWSSMVKEDIKTAAATATVLERYVPVPVVCIPMEY